ncbi:unnamed protein product [Vicia faba]|uniref:Uncharacterized protein n=1 Tax=Vicia faba TaxID=3906 RepID=A0AAV1AXC2_VICFA|nr:unnamed protein product [Vicia faba]
MQGSTMPMVSTSENIVLNQLPQPTRPLNCDDKIFETPLTVDQFNNIVVPLQPTMLKEDEGKKHFGNRVLDKIYEKLPAKLREEINLEHVLGKEGKRRDESETTISRGEEIGISDKEKLSRFKIRTVVAQDVVKEDEKK